MDLNRRFAELVGIEKDTFDCMNFDGTVSQFTKWPDFVSDPRLVLREMERLGELDEFMKWITYRYSNPSMFLLEYTKNYVLDTAGLLVKAAIEWLEKGEGK